VVGAPARVNDVSEGSVYNSGSNAHLLLTDDFDLGCHCSCGGRGKLS
jgi:hypothetical protein